MSSSGKTTKISIKLSTQVSAIITTLLIIITFLGLAMVYKIVDESSKEKLITEAQKYEYQIEGWIDGILKQANTVYTSIKDTEIINDKEKIFVREIMNEDGEKEKTKNGNYCIY